jgi:hypothetical protein
MSRNLLFTESAPAWLPSSGGDFSTGTLGIIAPALTLLLTASSKITRGTIRKI